MEIIVPSRKYGDHLLLIDDDDLSLIKGYTLNLVKKECAFYVYLKKGDLSIPIHRFLLNALSGIQVDHKNRNPLDNRRENLRLATQAQNSYNKFDEANSASGFKGVYWAKDKGMWCARISPNGKTVQGGYFKCKIDAAHRYNELAVKHFGEFTFLNTFTEDQLAARLNEPVWQKGRKRCLSGFKGVYKMGNRYIAHIRKDGKKVHIGCFGTDKEAAKAYNKEAIVYHGKGTYLNEV